jgi:hypothetical protein
MEAEYLPSFAATPTTWSWEARSRIVPARPSFYGFLGPRGLDEVPVFTRPDGSAIPHSEPQPVRNAGGLYRIDVAIDDGVVVVQYPAFNMDPERFVVDRSFVPRTRRTAVERDRTGTWLRVDSDAIALRVERADGRFEIESDARLVLLSPDKVRLTALYGDGREELIFERSPAWSPPPPVATPIDEGSGDGRLPELLLLLAVVASCGIARRASGSGDASAT